MRHPQKITPELQAKYEALKRHPNGYDILRNNIARMTREEARRSNESIEATVCRSLLAVVDDRASMVLLLKAFAQIAIEDHLRGSGPLVTANDGRRGRQR